MDKFRGYHKSIKTFSELATEEDLAPTLAQKQTQYVYSILYENRKRETMLKRKTRELAKQGERKIKKKGNQVACYCSSSREEGKKGQCAYSYFHTHALLFH